MHCTPLGAYKEHFYAARCIVRRYYTYAFNIGAFPSHRYPKE